MDRDDAQQTLTSSIQLADHLERRFDLMTSRGRWVTRQYGAAALLRGCELLRASIACLSAGQTEAIGVLSRALLESWVSGAFVMFGGADALARLDAERQRQEGNLIKANDVKADDLLASRKAELNEAAVANGIRLGTDGVPKWDWLTVELMAKELGPLIEKATGRDEEPLALYNMLYRSYSTFDAHGIYPLERRIDLDDLTLTTMCHPVPWVDPHASIGLSCLLLTTLAPTTCRGSAP